MLVELMNHLHCSPLKSFINANKPHSRQISKSKKTQSSVSLGVPIFSTTEDVVPESSSHSSSVENGELRKPFPQFPSVLSALPQPPDKETMDPHFAGLLSALADSVLKKGNQSANMVSTSNQPSIVNLKDIDLTVSSPATSPQETLSATFQIPPTEPSPPGPSLPSVPHTVDSAQSAVLPQLSRIPGKFLPTPLTSPNGNLFKQHIALLDAVSKESARMQEAYKTAAASGVTINDNFLSPIIATTARPSSLVPRSHVDTLQCPESAGKALPSFTTSHNADSSLISAELSGVFRQDAISDYDLQGRPSLAYHSDQTNAHVTGSVSMNQSHLLALMNGAPTNPTMLHTDYALPSSSQTSLLTPYRNMVLEPQLSPFTPHLPSPSSARSSAPIIPSYTPPQALPAASNALLSILNGGRRMS